MSQRECVNGFPLDTERFRIAPRYLFSEPPHAGMLNYEHQIASHSGSEWRAEAQKALKLLRALRRVTPRAD